MALPASDYVTSLAAAGPTSNVKLTASEAITGDKTINLSLIVGNGVNISNPANNPGVLTITSSALGVTAGAGQPFASDSINTSAFGPAAETILTTDANATLTVNASILGAATVLNKTGTGTPGRQQRRTSTPARRPLTRAFSTSKTATPWAPSPVPSA